MTKKTLFIIFSILTLFLITSSVFATDNAIGNTANNIGNQMQDSWNKLGNSMQNVGNTVRNGISNIGMNDNNTNNNTNNSRMMGMTGSNNTTPYTATRTATDTTAPMGLTSTMWTWLIFGILAVTIVALVWYYGTQKSDNEENHHI